jgi:PAS domain S-box-containing protein
MILLLFLDWTSWFKNIFDAVILVAIIAIPLYWFVFVPLEKFENDREMFKLAVEGASDHIMITDPDGRIVFANKAAETTTGYSLAEMVGKTPALWGRQMDPAFYKNFWETIKIKKLTFRGEINNKRKNGEPYIAALHVSPILDGKGNVLFFVGIEQDITKAKEIDRAKNEFVSLASHQLRTPLTSVRWQSEILSSGAVGRLNPEQQHLAEEISQAAGRIASIIGSFLDVSKIELGTFAAAPQTFAAGDAVDEILKELAPETAKKGLKINFDRAAAAVPIVTDRNALRTILQNLITNAVKYTPREGSVTVALSLAGKTLRGSISDTGCGIPASAQDRIFTKLYRADNARHMDPDGTGLGLYIAKSLIESLHGAISFTSSEGKGTTFDFTIPVG